MLAQRWEGNAKIRRVLASPNYSRRAHRNRPRSSPRSGPDDISPAIHCWGHVISTHRSPRQRTADSCPIPTPWNFSSVRFTDLDSNCCRSPAINRWATFASPLRGLTALEAFDRTFVNNSDERLLLLAREFLRRFELDRLLL